MPCRESRRRTVPEIVGIIEGAASAEKMLRIFVNHQRLHRR